MDNETRRKKQQALMVELVTRKVRSRAQQIYDSRGRVEGQALEHWVQAESEVLGKSILGPMYRRLRTDADGEETKSTTPDLGSGDQAVSEA